MPRLITASFTSNVTKDAPGEIVYIPLGSNRINATIGGKPGVVTVRVMPDKGHAIAEKLQASLAQRLTGTVRPRLAFDHSRTGPASGHPESFRFDTERGIMLSAAWSNSGRAAIEGGDYGYFSPTFLIANDGTPSGLPDKGEIGSLVDEPAFRAIGLIAASESQQENNMESIYSALQVSASEPNQERAALSKISAMQSDDQLKADKIKELTEEKQCLESELTVLKASAVTVNEKLAAFGKARATDLVKAAVTDGRLMPKDTDKQEKFIAKIEAGDTFAEEILSQLPKVNLDLKEDIVLAADKKDKYEGLTGSQLLEAALSEEFQKTN